MGKRYVHYARIIPHGQAGYCALPPGDIQYNDHHEQRHKLDTVDPSTRSRIMSGIRRKDTSPERWLRKQLFRDGFRFRIDVRKLPGSPDIKLAKYRAVVFVHGCFWHGHGCRYFRMPSTRTAFWAGKIATNRQRDATVLGLLAVQGWRVAIVWECAIRQASRAEKLSQEKPSLVGMLETWLRSDLPFIELSGQTTDHPEQIAGSGHKIASWNGERDESCVAESISPSKSYSPG